MSSESSFDEDEEISWGETLQRIKENDPRVKSIIVSRRDDIQDLTDEELEELGHAIANNTHLTEVDLSYSDEALNDHRMSLFFQGLTGSSSIIELNLGESEFGVAGVRSMVPFLQNTNNLTNLDLDDNNLQSEGFNVLFRALRDSPIEKLSCENCRIESIEINREQMTKHLEYLNLEGNSIKTDGCRELAKLLQGVSTLTELHLEKNDIDDEGVEILVDALKSNKSLRELYLMANNGISKRGLTMLFKLVCDISSIEATLQSNHTLGFIRVIDPVAPFDAADEIQLAINLATRVVKETQNDPDKADRVKVFSYQLHSELRGHTCRLQGVNHSLYSEIDPLHLPEVLSLVGHYHDQGELYVALSSSIMALLSTVNTKRCLQEERAYHAAKVEELDAKLAMMEEAEAAMNVGVDNINHCRGRVESDEYHSNKRRRKWWWGLWGKTT
jgi:hypothetical protein